MLGYSPAALAGADVIRCGVGAIVCFPSTNARLLATVCRGGNAVVVVAVVVNGVRSECQVRLLIGYILSIFKHLTHLTIQ